MTKVILPPATVGIVGGGQLGRMLALAAKAMGYQVGVLDPTPNAPAGQVADFQLVNAYADTDALTELAERSDVLTYEFENVDLDALNRVSALAALPQGTQLLAITRNRLNEKQFLQQIGVATTAFASVPDADSLAEAVATIGYPAILKTSTGGYDGHGQVDLNSPADLDQAVQLASHAPCILEAHLSFTRELSLMITRDGRDQTRCFPVVENHHQHHILHTTIAPAPQLSEAKQQQIDQMAEAIAQALDLRGVLGVELFDTPAGIVVNELAPRPHNSGHYSIEGCNLSQFDAHIRSICGLAMPRIQLVTPCVMRNLLGEELQAAQAQWPTHPEWHLHDYGKAEAKPGRKMGHLTVTATDWPQAKLIAATQLKGE